MSANQVTIFDTGTSNLASMITALEGMGQQVNIAQEASNLGRAVRLVLPGVGTYRAICAAADRPGVRDVLTRLIANGTPTLAVCLGMQFLGEQSEEAPACRGLSILPLSSQRFANDVRVPQLGWNHVQPSPSCRLLRSGFAYFAHSFYFQSAPESAASAFTDHGTSFVAGFEWNNLLACQFHPELSGSWGLSLLNRWLKGTGG